MNHFFLHPYRVIVVVCVGVVLLLPAILDQPNYEKYLAATQWETDGAFVANGQPNPRDFPSCVLLSPDARFWRNYTPTKGKMPAQLRSAPFVLRNNRVIIPVVGFPNSKDAEVYLESEANYQRFWIRDGAADRKNVDLIHLGIACQPGLIGFATTFLFKILLRNASRAPHTL